MARAPRWFWGAAVALLLWSLAGIAAFAAHLSVDATALARMPADDAAAFRALPPWFVYAFALATLPALFGAVALLARRRGAVPLYALALIGAVIQFGYVLGATDLLARKGGGAAVLPAVIIALGMVSLWLARHDAARGWLR